MNNIVRVFKTKSWNKKSCDLQNIGTSGVTPQWNFYKYLLDHHGNLLQVWPPQTPVEDIYDAVEAAVHEADGEVQVESPLGAHDEL